jgi:MFS family permease
MVRAFSAIKNEMRETGLVVFLLINMFLWYYLALNAISLVSRSTGFDQSDLFFLYSLGAIVGGAVGLPFSKKHHNIMLLWVLLGIAASFLPLSISILTQQIFQLICLVWGFSIELGMPSCLSFFAENVEVEKRGRLSGTVLLLALFCANPLGGLILSFGLPMSYLFLGFWRMLGLIPLLAFRVKHEKFGFAKSHEDREVPISRGVYLYLIPWFIFNVVDGLEGLLLRNFVKATFPNQFTLLQFIGLVLLGIFAFFGGFLCDLVGRKIVTILGFVIMGIAYAIISMAPTSLTAWFSFYVCNSFSWGLFTVVFVMVIWGDLAPKEYVEKYFFIGTFPYFLTAIVQRFFASYIASIRETNAFSLAALFLFLAVLPILFAPETLPEKAIRERELRSYIEKAKRVREKFTKG